MTSESDEIRRKLKLVRFSENSWATADGRWCVNTRTGEQSYDGVPLELNYWEERERWAKRVDESELPDQRASRLSTWGVASPSVSLAETREYPKH